jgi:hypothetical protein
MDFLKPKSQRMANSKSKRLLFSKIEKLKAKADELTLYSVSEKLQSLINLYISFNAINYGMLNEFEEVLNRLTSMMKSTFVPLLLNRLEKLVFMLENPIDSFSKNPTQNAIEVRKMISFEKQSIQSMINILKVNLETAFQDRNKSLYEELENEIELLENEISQVEINYKIYANLSKNLRKIDISKKNAKLTSEAAKISSTEIDPYTYQQTLNKRSDDIILIKDQNEKLSNIDNQSDAIMSNNIFNKRSSYDDRIEAEFQTKDQQIKLQEPIKKMPKKIK